MKNTTRAASVCSSHSRSCHLPILITRSFPRTHGTSFQNILLSLIYEYQFLLAFFIFAFSDCVDLKYWGCFSLSISLLFLFHLCFLLFSSKLLASSVIKKKVAVFQLNIFSVISVLDRSSSNVWSK
jgi:hypothetical protein